MLKKGLNYFSQFIEQWLGHISSVILVFTGVLICVLVISAFWDKKMRGEAAIAGVTLGLILTFNQFVAGLIHRFGADDNFRFVIILLSIIGITGTTQVFSKKVISAKYGLFWIIFFLTLFITAVIPKTLQNFLDTVGMSYHGMVEFFVIGFLLLICFMFSFHINKLQKKIDNIKTEVDGFSPELKENNYALKDEKRPVVSDTISTRPVRGTKTAALLIIFLAACSVFTIGLMTPEPMVGDEVTHYYMLVKQSHDLSKPNFYADIPMANGGIEVRRYPHSFVWHYLGALLYHFSGGSFLLIQSYQAFFLVQLLLVSYLLARSRGGVESRSALVYVLTIASLPLCLVFSVAFYQDVPMTAQALTAFYLLTRKRWLLSAFFMAFAIGLKVTAILFYPAFFFLFAHFVVKYEGWKRGSIIFLCSLLIVFTLTWSLGRAINIYAEAAFYPQEKIEQIFSKIRHRFSSMYPANMIEKESTVSSSKPVDNYALKKTKETKPVIIANNPGDLRIKVNFLIYGGVVLWLVLFLGLLLYLPWPGRRGVPHEMHSSWWLWLTGCSYLLFTALFTKTAPDARFFLPGLPFILLPVVEKIVQLPRPKFVISLLTALALMQGGYVLAKTYRLRVVTPEIKAAIAYLAEYPPVPAKIFMYPEGNYRLFSVQHEWYLGYKLREFWRSDNDRRIKILHKFGVGEIVIKKQLISPVDEKITNLGVYPDYFVKDIYEDKRFTKLFENAGVVIFRVP